MSPADKEAGSCKDKVAELNKAVAELGPLIRAAQVVVGDAASAQAKQYGVDGDKLGAEPCALDIILLPFDEDKGSPEEWQHYAGAQAWSLHPSALDSLKIIPTPACLRPDLLLANALLCKGALHEQLLYRLCPMEYILQCMHAWRICSSFDPVQGTSHWCTVLQET